MRCAVGWGAPPANGTVIADVGAAYAFRNSGGWQEQITLQADDQQPFVGFGAAVDIDGPTIVVGAPGHLASLGAIHVFRESPAGGSWVEVGRTFIQKAGAAGDEFGNAVAANGDVIAVGARQYNHNTNCDTSLVSIFRKPAFDCNGNFVPDGCDIQSGASQDVNQNGVPDECEPLQCVSADINCDGFVDETDRDLFVAVLIGTSTDPDHVARSDLNGDSEVNGLDIGLFVSPSTSGG